MAAMLQMKEEASVVVETELVLGGTFNFWILLSAKKRSIWGNDS